MGCDEQFDDYGRTYKAPPKIAYADKARKRGRTSVHPLMEEGVQTQYASDVDIWLGGFSVPGDPERWNWEPQRIIFDVSSYEDAIAISKNHGDGDYPVKVLKRTVTYGPWEEITK